jgi:hypothetical protein
VHGAEVAVVTGGPAAGHDRGAVTTAPTADAQVTTVAGIALAVLTADCVPVLLASRRGPPVVGVAHAGRLGVQRGVVAAAVASLIERRVRPGDLSALVGPAVCAGCYEVPTTMRHEVALGVPVAAATSAVGTPSLDLPAAVVSQLREAGVDTVHREETCTAESERLYSHRRDGVTGRQAGVVWLPA